MAFFCIKQSFDTADYSGVSPSCWDKPPTLQAVKDLISGETVKFETIDADFSAPIAAELEISAVQITTEEKASVTDIIRAKATKTEYEDENGDPQDADRQEYWRST